MKEFAKTFYASTAWQQCRLAYIASVHGMCERCTDVGYIVHHKTLLTPKNIDDAEITLSFKQLEFLCLTCHNTEHMGSSEAVTREDIYFDEYGDVQKK